MRTSGFVSLSKAMFLGMARDRSAVFFTLLFPLMFLVLFGALFKGGGTPHVKVIEIGPVAVLDRMPAPERAALKGVLEVHPSTDRADALAKVRKGDADAALWQSGGTVGMSFSSADAVRSGTVRTVIQSVVQEANLAATGRPPAFTLATEQVEDTSTKPIQYLTPGLLGWAVAMGSTFSSALTLVGWRRKRILRRLWLAPVSAASVIGARVGVSLALAFVQTGVFVAVATLPYFGLRLTGHWWLALPLIACGTLAFMSIGLVAGAWAKTEEAAQGMAQIIVLPMAFLSGSFFPLDAAPGWVRDISQVLPLKHLATAMQGVLSRGQGWAEALPTMGGLLVFAAVLTLIAARLFRWDDA